MLRPAGIAFTKDFFHALWDYMVVVALVAAAGVEQPFRVRVEVIGIHAVSYTHLSAEIPRLRRE